MDVFIQILATISLYYLAFKYVSVPLSKRYTGYTNAGCAGQIGVLAFVIFLGIMAFLISRVNEYLITIPIIAFALYTFFWVDE